MKLSNLIALPFGLVADAVSFGEAGVTRRIFNNELHNQEIEAIEALAKLIAAKKENHDQ